MISNENDNENQQKYWVGGKYKIILKKYNDNRNEKLNLRLTNNKIAEILGDNILMKSSGRECLLAFKKGLNSKICFNIYNTPPIKFREINPIKIETNNFKHLKLDTNGYPKTFIKYKSNHPEIIKVDNEGNINAIRPGNALITAAGLDYKKTHIKVLSISSNGFLNNYILNKLNINQYKNVMIVAHPDDETLWGGANLIKEKYFIVCLTNGYNFARANDFTKILKFTKNGGIILNYPDIQDFIRDDWSKVEKGILKDLSLILNYKYWNKIVTHGPDGTTGHFHHKKTCQFVTDLSKKYHKYDNLYYFGKFYKKNQIPKNLTRITAKELEFKIKEVSLYKSVNSIIKRLWFHML